MVLQIHSRHTVQRPPKICGRRVQIWHVLACGLGLVLLMQFTYLYSVQSDGFMSVSSPFLRAEDAKYTVVIDDSVQPDPSNASKAHHRSKGRAQSTVRPNTAHSLPPVSLVSGQLGTVALTLFPGTPIPPNLDTVPPNVQPPATPEYGIKQGGNWGPAGGWAGRIPRLIHQTWKGGAGQEMSDDEVRWTQSWMTENAGWQVWLYDDRACTRFVHEQYPQYEDLYNSFKVNVQRADLFRYLIVLKYGGIYADLDTECKTPLDTYIHSTSPSLVVGIENEFESIDAAISRSYTRQRQLIQWIFAAEPSHPALAELAQRVADRAHPEKGGNNKGAWEVDTLEISGPAIYSDVMAKYTAPLAPLHYQASHPAAILPRVVWGANPASYDGLTPTDLGVRVLHHFSSSWRPPVKCRSALWRAPPSRGATRTTAAASAAGHLRHAAVHAPPQQLPGSAASYSTAAAHAHTPFVYIPHFSGISFSRDFWSWTSREHYARCSMRLSAPRSLHSGERAMLYEPVAVTVPSVPSVTLLVHHMGYEVGLHADSRDESNEISTHGVLQSGNPPSRSTVPSVADALLGFLGTSTPQDENTPTATANPPLLIDAGAGLGLTTLLASARALPVLALEGNPDSLTLLEASLSMAVTLSNSTSRGSVALSHKSPSQGNGVRCTDHHIPTSVYESALKAVASGHAQANPLQNGSESLNVVPGKGVFGKAPWYSSFVERVARGAALACGGHKMPVQLAPIDTVISAYTQVGQPIGGLKISAEGGLSRALAGAHRLLNGTLHPRSHLRSPRSPHKSKHALKNVTHYQPRSPSDASSDDSGDLRHLRRLSNSAPSGGDGPVCSANPADCGQAALGTLTPLPMRQTQGLAQSVDAFIPVPWILQLDVNPSAVASAYVFAPSALQILNSVADFGYGLRVYHWGPSCQQHVEAVKGVQRGDVDEGSAWWCRVDGSGRDGLRDAVARIPKRRTEHFLLLHSDTVKLSAPSIGDRALDWMATMDSVSVV